MRSLIIHCFILLGLLFPAFASAATPMVSAGTDHTVALKSDGTVVSWGSNAFGQLGDGTIINSVKVDPNQFPLPVFGVQVPGLSSVQAVAAGGNHTVALKSDGTVAAWGYNGGGQLGDGTIIDRWSPVTVPGLSGVVALAAGNAHTVALKADGTVWAWGNNMSGQLGNGWQTSISPMMVPGLTGVIAVSAGQDHTLALKSDGTVWAWGGNLFGQLGVGTLVSAYTPVQVPGLSGVVSLAAGANFSVALKSDGTIWAWGDNSSGQLGNANTAVNPKSPILVAGVTGVAVVAGGYHMEVLKSDGTVIGWGSNNFGQLGNGAYVGGASPVVPTGFLGNVLTGIISLSAGTLHTVALRADGTVWAWGNNGSGQLGVTWLTNPTPTAVPGLALMPPTAFGPKLAQTISFGSVPVSLVMNSGGGVISATSTMGLPVSLSSLTPALCDIPALGNGINVVQGYAAGTCIIAANQLGDAYVNAAPQVTQTIVINKLSQLIGFRTVAPLTVGGTGTVVATCGSRGVVTFSSTTPLVCSISGNTVTALAQGNCVLAADQAGNASYNAAPQVTQSFAITTTPVVTPVNPGGGLPTVTLNFALGWNLMGNSVNSPLDVATTLGNPANVTTVWKWIPATSRWAFYAPSMTAPALATYAASKGYDVLSTINGGEGFWVNAKSVFTAQLPTGTAISSTSFANQTTPPNGLPMGWSLIAVGDNPLPRNFANTLSVTPPVAPAIAATSLTTLWAWDSTLSNWYFYAPSLDNSGGLAAYITSKGYLDFATKMLYPTMGFWVNHP